MQHDASHLHCFAAVSPTIPTVHHTPRADTHVYTCSRSYGDDDYPAIKILDHRVKNGELEVLIKWKGINPKNKMPWPPSWEPEKFATPDLLSYYKGTAFQLKPHYTDGAIDVTPLYRATML